MSMSDEDAANLAAMAQGWGRLADATMKAMTPIRSPWNEHQAARVAEHQAVRDAQHDQAIAALNAAADDWRATCQRSETNPVVAAVLKLHRPHGCGAYDNRIGCTECRQGAWDGDRAVDWPCNTYTAIKENAS